MRAMIYQRLLWAAAAQESTQTNQPPPSTQALKDTILIFGCRGENSDYFFQDEWAALQSREVGLTVLTAFSRDKERPRQYVQDQIRANGDMISRALVDGRGKVYVCGSSGNMPKGVREALLDVLGSHGSVATREEAEKYVDAMENRRGGINRRRGENMTRTNNAIYRCILRPAC